MQVDRQIVVPEGQHVETGYVEIHKVRLACKERIAIGDVENSYRQLLQLAPSQPFPPPNGFWDGETFVIKDGRHTFVAALMLGFKFLFVAWLSNASIPK